MKTLAIAAFAATFIGSFACFASAEETPHAGYRETGVSRDWVGIFSPDRGIGQATASCAIYSRPTEAGIFVSENPVDAMRGELAAFVAWNESGVSDVGGEISFMVGTPVIEGLDAEHVLTINGDVRFDLVGVGDRLYVAPKDDAAAIAALRRGVQMVVSAKSRDGGVVKVIYSLMGIQSMTDIQKAECV